MIQVPAKWILAGEHTVLRGGAAIAFPWPELSLRARFEPGGAELVCDSDTAREVAIEAFEGEPPAGRLTLESRIPSGAGLGSSAALCVAVARWRLGDNAVVDDLIHLATRLENRFHGTSSGLDVAVVARGAPIVFTREHGARLIKGAEGFRFTLHDTGLRSSTRACVDKVSSLPRDLRDSIDHRMRQAVESARQALEGGSPGARDLAEAVRLAGSCFEDWGLVPPHARDLMARLLRDGALAAKPTGAGGGGFVLAVWG